MSYYPPGAYEMLVNIQNEYTRRDKAYNAAKQHRIVELRQAAQDSHPVSFNTGVRMASHGAIQSVSEELPSELIDAMVRAWMIGDMELMAKNAYAACEIAFEKAVDFFATCDAEFNHD